MPVFYGKDINPDQTSTGDLALPSIAPTAAAFTHGARLRKSQFVYNVADGTNLATSDVIRMGTIRSNDRIYDLRLSCDVFPSSTTVNIGLYLSGTSHDGAAVDANLFASAQALTSALHATSILVESTNLTGVDRGKYAWELAALGDGSDTTDPRVEYDICLVLTADPAATSGILDIMLELDYVAGS